MGGQRHAPNALPQGKKPSSHYTGGWVDRGSVWTCAENLAATRIRIPDRPARSQPRYGWRSSLRHCATSRKFAGSIPDGVIWIFHWQSFRSHYGPGVDSASHRNEYQEYFLGGKGGQCVQLTNLPPSCADCLEIWEPRPPETLRACPGL